MWFALNAIMPVCECRFLLRT
ncbi:protein of unknown function [Rhodovastum atsumiense]|nr:protein of unknown function [Rhodovastum atsumiense]